MERLCFALGYSNTGAKPKTSLTNETIPWSRTVLNQNGTRALDFRQWSTLGARGFWREEAEAFLEQNKTRAEGLWPHTNSAPGALYFPEDIER